MGSQFGQIKKRFLQPLRTGKGSYNPWEQTIIWFVFLGKFFVFSNLRYGVIPGPENETMHNCYKLNGIFKIKFWSYHLDPVNVGWIWIQEGKNDPQK